MAGAQATAMDDSQERRRPRVHACFRPGNAGVWARTSDATQPDAAGSVPNCGNRAECPISYTGNLGLVVAPAA